MADGNYSVHLGVKILAVLDLAVFFTWNLLWSMTKRGFVCFGKNYRAIDYDFSDDDSEDSLSQNLSTPIPIINNPPEELSPLHGVSALGWTAFGLGVTFGLAVVIGFIFLELWLCWTLYRAARERQMSLCTKWLIWRVLLLAILFIGIINETVSKHCLHLPMMIYVAFRIFSIIGVSEYRRCLSRYPNPNFSHSKSEDKLRLEADFY